MMYFIDKVDYNKCSGQSDFPTVDALVKLIMRERLKSAPPIAHDIFFDIGMNFVSNSFLKGELIVENDARHLMYFTDQQLFHMFS